MPQKRLICKEKKEKLFPEITIDYETTVVGYRESEMIKKGLLTKNTVELFAYSVQICLLWQKEDETGKVHNRFETHIFLDYRVPRIAEPDNDVILHDAYRDCVEEAVLWLEELFYKHRTSKTKRSDYGARIIAHAFNAGFEESYTVYSILNMGYESLKVIPRGLGGVMISSFAREAEYVGQYGVIKNRKHTFTIKETAGQWAANVRLSNIFEMYGLGSKTETPLLSYNDKTFYFAQSEALAYIDKDFLRYAAKDVKGLFQALLKKRHENGQPKTMTASSTTLLKHREDFIKRNGEPAYERFFMPASMTLDEWLRPYTLGGYNYINPLYKNLYQYPDGAFVKFLGIDRTNAYLSVMCSCVFPIGRGVHFYGQYKPDETYPFFFQKIHIKSCILKRYMMPSLQWKHGVAEDVIGINEDTPEYDRDFILNAEELELLHETYKNLDYDYVDGYMFEQAEGSFLFGDYLKDKFYSRKKIKGEIAELKKDLALAPNQHLAEQIQQLTAQADTLKLWGNGLYGKFFENPNKTQGHWQFDEQGELEFISEDVVLERHSPSHIGSQVLRCQRLALIKACNKVIAAGGTIFQCDTDAFLCGINRQMAEKYPNITAEQLANIAGIKYGEDLGEWHLEKEAMEGISVEKKVYAWSHDALSFMEREQTYDNLKKKGHKFYHGTRGVKKADAIAQLTPNTWRRGEGVWTTQFARLDKARKGMIKIWKVLAI